MKMMKMKMMIRMMKLVIYGSAHHNEDSRFAQYCNSHHISAIVLRVPGTNIPSLLSLILYSQFNLDDSFFFFSSKDCLEYCFCSVGLGDFCSVHRGNEFCFKTILCLNPHLNHLWNPSCERILEGAQKKQYKGLEAPLMSENLCHKLLPGSHQKKFFLWWRWKSRCLIF